MEIDLCMLYLYITIYYLQSLNHCLMEKPVLINIGFLGRLEGCPHDQKPCPHDVLVCKYVPNTTLSSLPSLFKSGFLPMSYICTNKNKLHIKFHRIIGHIILII